MNLSRATYQKYFVFDVNGHPLNGGRVSTYVDGTSTPAVTYKDREGTIKNPTTITLDSRGEAEIWLDTSVTYKFVVTDKHGRLVGQYDHVTANTKTFSAEGSDTIEATEQVVDGKTVVTFRVKEGSIGVNEFKNPLPLVAGDGIKLTPHDVDGTTVIVVELSDEVKAKLEALNG